MTARIMGAIAISLVVGLAGCEKDSARTAPTDGPAGKVIEVSGSVSVERDGRAESLATGAEVFGADVIITGDDGAVTIELFHNQARWSLDAGKRKQVDRSVAWRAPKQAAGGLLASNEDGEGTAAAGRHAEKEAADTAATALMPQGGAPVAAESDTEVAPEVPAAAAPGGAPAKPAATPPAPPPPPPAPPKPAPAADGLGTIGDGVATGGHGIKGTGAGGGGTGEGTIGTGKYGTIGHGSGSGSGYGAGSGKLGGRSGTAPKVKVGNAQVQGSLDKNIIRRYVRRQLPAIRHCYEKELTKTPDLAGKVTVSFTIGADGKVAAAKQESSLPEPVASCVLARVKTLVFPKPKGGGVVQVTYPFVFAPAD